MLEKAKNKNGICEKAHDLNEMLVSKISNKDIKCHKCNEWLVQKYFTCTKCKISYCNKCNLKQRVVFPKNTFIIVG